MPVEPESLGFFTLLKVMLCEPAAFNVAPPPLVNVMTCPLILGVKVPSKSEVDEAVVLEPES